MEKKIQVVRLFFLNVYKRKIRIGTHRKGVSKASGKFNLEK